MTKTIAIKNLFRVGAALVIAMLPLQFGFAQTYHYENSTDGSAVSIYQSVNNDSSSWFTHTEEETTIDNDSVVTRVVVRSSSSQNDDEPSDWRERWLVTSGINEQWKTIPLTGTVFLFDRLLSPLYDTDIRDCGANQTPG